VQNRKHETNHKKTLTNAKKKTKERKNNTKKTHFIFLVCKQLNLRLTL